MSTNPLDPKLFSPSCAERYQAVLNLKSDCISAEPTWEGCWGAANGWSMMIGPSPGPMKNDSPDKTSQSVARGKYPGISFGPKAGLVNFEDERKKSRSTNWNRLAKAMAYGNADWAMALTTVCNLDFLNFAAEKDIPKERLEQGCPFVFEVMKMTKPVVISPLTVRVYYCLVSYFKQIGVFQATEVNRMDSRYPLIWVRLPGCEFDSLVVKAPKHPSWVPSAFDLAKFSGLIGGMNFGE